MIVDSGAWVDYFNGVRNPVSDRLDRALASDEDLAILPVILTEVLQGFRTDTGFRRAAELLGSLPIAAGDVPRHIRAARLHRALRRKGVTVRGAVDCLIAQTAIDLEVELLTPDRDFERIARHFPLRLWRPGD